MVRSGGRWSGGGSLRVASRKERCRRSRWTGFLLVVSSAGLPAGDGVSSFFPVSVASLWVGGPSEDLPQPVPPRPSKPATTSQTRPFRTSLSLCTVITLLLLAGWRTSFPLRGGVCSLAPFRRQPRLPAQRARIDPVPSRPLEYSHESVWRRGAGFQPAWVWQAGSLPHVRKGRQPCFCLPSSFPSRFTSSSWPTSTAGPAR